MQPGFDSFGRRLEIDNSGLRENCDLPDAATRMSLESAQHSSETSPEFGTAAALVPKQNGCKVCAEKAPEFVTSAT